MENKNLLEKLKKLSEKEISLSMLCEELKLNAYEILALAGELSQHLFAPCNDLIAIGGDNINNTGDGGERGNDLQNSSKYLHRKASDHFYWIMLQV